MKKLIATLVSAVLATSSLATAFASVDWVGDPYIGFRVSEVDDSAYASATGSTVPDGSQAYQIAIDIYGVDEITQANFATNSNGGGNRIGTYTFKLYTEDLDNISEIHGFNYSEWEEDDDAEEYRVDTYGALLADGTTKNYIDNSITAAKFCTSVSATFPYKKAQADKVVDGTLENAIIIYVVASAPVTITETYSKICLQKDGIEEANTTVCNDTKDIEDVTFGPTGSTGAEKATIAQAVQGGNLNGQYTFYAAASIDMDNTSKPQLYVAKGGAEEKYFLPGGFAGVVTFTAIVRTAETGEYTYKFIDGTTDLTTAQTVTVQ